MYLTLHCHERYYFLFCLNVNLKRKRKKRSASDLWERSHFSSSMLWGVLRRFMDHCFGDWPSYMYDLWSCNDLSVVFARVCAHSDSTRTPNDGLFGIFTEVHGKDFQCNVRLAEVYQPTWWVWTTASKFDYLGPSDWSVPQNDPSDWSLRWKERNPLDIASSAKPALPSAFRRNDWKGAQAGLK